MASNHSLLKLKRSGREQLAQMSLMSADADQDVRGATGETDAAVQMSFLSETFGTANYVSADLTPWIQCKLKHRH